MSFEKQKALFKNSMASAAAKMGGGPKATPRAPAPPSRPNDAHWTTYMSSQTARTGAGESMMVKVTHAIRWLRAEDQARTLDDILEQVDPHGRAGRETKAALADVLRQSGSVEWTPDADRAEQTWASGTYRYRAAVPFVRTKAQLLAYLQGRTDAGGVSVKDLKDGWPTCEGPIEELETEHRLLVLRQKKKDGGPRAVWPDDPSLFHHVDDEFKALWTKVEVPAVDVLVQRLAAVGQKAVSEDPRLSATKQPKVVKKKRQTRRGGKLTNLHMEDKFKNLNSTKKG